MNDEQYSAAQLIEFARTSGLVSANELASLRGSIVNFDTLKARDLVDQLVDRKLITPYQADRLLAGDGQACVLCGRYRIRELLGAGAMGSVFRADDLKLGRQVAIKVLPDHSIADPDAVARFQREALAMARLTHTNIVQAFDAGEDQGKHFLVMECVEGQSVAQLLKERGPLSAARAADIGYQTAIGLQHAHDKGLVHRDLKPSNLFLTPQGHVKILDLGLARFLQDQMGDSTLTRAGSGMGTPDYMAPEQFHDARHVDQRSDVYSLGCTLYHLIAGQVPFPGSSLSQKYQAHVERDPAPLESLSPDVPTGLAITIGRMMAKHPADRFQTAREVAEALAPYVAGSSHISQQVRATATWTGSQLGLSVVPVHVQRRRRARLAALLGVGASLIAMASFWAGNVSRTATDDIRQRERTTASSGNMDSGVDAEGAMESTSTVVDPEPDVLTVAQDGSAEFPTLNRALAKVRSGQTIRVLDDAVYRESLLLNLFEMHRGITIEAQRGATIEFGQVHSGIAIVDVPGLRLRGFKIRVGAKTNFALTVSGRGSGTILENITFESESGSQNVGIGLEAIRASEDDERPLVVRNCTFRNGRIAIRVSGFGPRYDESSPCARVQIRDNLVDGNGVGFVLVGQLNDLQVVGNRIWRATSAGIQMENFLPGTKNVLVANNTISNSTIGLRIWDSQVRGDNVEVSNNLIVGSPVSDMTFTDSGGNPDQARGYGNGEVVFRVWNGRSNWREGRPVDAGFQPPDGWIRPANTDQRQERIPLLTYDIEDQNFLKPDADSPLASGGAGTSDPTLPTYVGAVPPQGATNWEWQVTWDARHPKMLLTVSKDPRQGGEFRTINDALAKVTRPGTTIRVLDDAEYTESVQLRKRELHAGLILDSPRRATIGSSNQSSVILMLVGIPDVTVRGFRFHLNESRVAAIGVTGPSTGVVLDDLFFLSEQARSSGIVIDSLRANLESPLIIRRCSFEGTSNGIEIVGINLASSTPSQTRGIVIQQNRFIDNAVGVWAVGLVNDLVICGNRLHGSADVAVRFDQLLSGSGRIVVANNTIRTWGNGVEFAKAMQVPSEVTIRGNIIISDEGLDLAYLHDNLGALDAWRIDHNWRKPLQLASSDPQSKYWIPASADTLIERITFLSTEPSSSDFLRPAKDSPLANGGAGGDGPSYAGALAPPGEEEWDWAVKWRKWIATPADSP